MICPKCKTEMRIVAGRNVVTGGNSAEEKTKLYRVVDHKCVNPKCSNKEIIIERIPLEMEEE